MRTDDRDALYAKPGGCLGLRIETTSSVSTADDLARRARTSVPAFPQAIAVGSGDAPVASYDFEDGAGMSLRDYFAAHAMHALLSTAQPGAEYTATVAYNMADAMLIARAKSEHDHA